MNKRITHIVLFILISLFSISLIAQPENGQRPGGGSGYGGGQMGDLGDLGVVMGMIVSSEKEPMQYATVYVLNPKDSTVVTGGLTDDKGFILIKDIKWGTYILEISAMGYQKHYTNPFTLSSTTKRYNLKQFVLTKKANRIGEVEVTAKKEMLQQNLDKKIYNVENNVIADGASAVEVLTEIPSVDVDLDGNVSLRGSTNVRILIDGRPTDLTLDQIPASQIQSIEVITNPSARFEPDGMSGIINVVLKKNKSAGMNGLVSLGSAVNVFQNKVYFETYNANANFNYHIGKINFYLNYSYGRNGFHGAGTMDRTSWFNADTSYLFKEEFSNSLSNRHNLKTSLDYQINDFNLLSFGFGFNKNQFGDTNMVNYENYNYMMGEQLPINLYNQNGSSGRNGTNYNANISYKYTSGKVKGREFSSDLFYTQMGGIYNSDYLQVYDYPLLQPNYYQLTNTSTLNRTSTAQLDYVTPIGNGGRIETGYKFSFRTIGQDYALFYGTDETNTIEDITQSNNFEYREYINAAYFIYSNTFFKKFKVQLGLRGEAANTYSDLKSADTTYQKPYYNLFPTVHVRYELNEKNQFQLSYSRRVTRPSFWDLNPFVDVSDKQNIRMGNPNLAPELADNIELGYTTYIKSATLNFTAFYRIRSNLITRYTQMLQANVQNGYIYYELMDGQIFSTPVVSGYDTLSTFPYTLTSSQNISSSQNFGLELVYSQRLMAFWRLNVSGDFYRVLINSDDLIDPNLSKDWAYGVRVNQTFNLPKDWDIQLNFRFRSKSLTTGSMGGFHGGGVGQGRRNESYSLNLGVKKGFMKNNLTVSLNIRDLIYNPDNIILTYAYYPTSGYNATSVRWRSQFQANLTVSYKFNNYKERRDKQRDMDSIEPSME
jgi:outer membrane receptor protein involved in Fe transport